MKKRVNLRSVNLNLLPVLSELLHQRNVSEAARRLNLTQSAVSAALKRLREMFDDELLVIRGREMILTERAARLLPDVERFMETAATFLEERPFDPATANDRFHIATADYVTALLMPGLGPAMEREAPGVRVQITGGAPTTAKDLRQGIIDLVIAPEGIAHWLPLNFQLRESGFEHKVCFEEPLVAIERLGPEEPRPYDLDSYLARPHASFFFTSDVHASVEQEALEALGLRQNDRILVPEFTMLPIIVATTNAVSVVPRTVARDFSRWLPLRIFEPPIRLPPMRLVMVWSRARENEEPLAWFRRQVAETFRRRSEECG